MTSDSPSVLERSHVSDQVSTSVKDSVEPRGVGYVYLLTNLVNGKKYVGQTIRTLSARWRQHKYLANKGSPYAIHAAIRKYGDKNFSIICVSTIVGDRNELLTAERRYIAEYQSLAPLGYNLTEGGEGVDFSVLEVKERHLQSVRGRSQEWRRHTIEAARKRASDPKWIHSNRETLLRLHGDEVFRKVHSEAMRRLHADPVYRDAVKNGLKNMRDREKWRVGVAKGLEKGRAIRTTNALLKDMSLPPEERARRIKRRACVQKSREKKKGVVGV